jgi:uncharacterized protein DUF4387
VRSLGEVARAVKSANAGASLMTFDVVFDDSAGYEDVVARDVITPQLVAALYGVEPAEVRVYACEAVLTVKVTIPRRTPSGGPDETDFDGVQQFIPLLEVRL